jgi:class 3 adenylate cyclase
MFTFLFTDIEGSTTALRRLGDGLYAQVLADHHALVRAGLAAHDGEEVDTQGDAFSPCSPHRGPSSGLIRCSTARSSCYFSARGG